MSMKILFSALSGNPAARKVTISEGLFDELSNANELTEIPVSMPVPTDELYGAAIEPWLRSIGIDPDLNYSFLSYRLIKHQRVMVERAISAGLRLDATGLNSFIIV